MIGIDASGVFDSVKQAEQAWSRIDSLGVDFLEDPFPADRPELASELARRLPVPVAYGESITSPLAMQRLAEDIGGALGGWGGARRRCRQRRPHHRERANVATAGCRGRLVAALLGR